MELIKLFKLYTRNFNQSFSDINANNQFNKKLRALKKYCPQAYKFLLFKHNKNNLVDGFYEDELPTFKEFKFVYGQIKIQYEIKNGIPIYKNLEPSQFFIDGYKLDLNVYRGVYYRNNRDKFMIDLFFILNK